MGEFVDAVRRVRYSAAYGGWCCWLESRTVSRYDAVESHGFAPPDRESVSMPNGKFWVTEESSFVILRALAMLGGMVAILLVPHPPEHQPYLGTLAWSFAAYKVGLFLAIRMRPAKLRAILLASVCLDLAFVSLFVWFGGGIGSHFYLLFYLLVALVAVQFEPGVGLATAGAAGGLYALATMAARRRKRLAPSGRARGHVLPFGRIARVPQPARAAGAGPRRGAQSKPPGESGPAGAGLPRAAGGAKSAPAVGTAGDDRKDVGEGRARGAESAELGQPEHGAVGRRTLSAAR